MALIELRDIHKTYHLSDESSLVNTELRPLCLCLSLNQYLNCLMLLNQLQPIGLLLEKCFSPISEFNGASGALDFAKLSPLFQVM